jgi:uncharacterized protein (DUF1919 family)
MKRNAQTETRGSAVRPLARRVAQALNIRVKRARTAGIRRRLGQQVRELEEQGISIISNNCVAGIFYEMAALRKGTPTAGLWFSGRSFAEFLLDLASGQLERWQGLKPEGLTYNEQSNCWERRIGNRGAIVFLHYSSPVLATEKWNNRLMRIEGRDLIVIASPQGGLTAGMLAKPAKLFRYFFLVSDEEAPPADELVLDPHFLRQFSDYVGSVLAARKQTAKSK